ncbi:plasmid recombination protein [Ruminococcus sp.]|uniref:plasmid recombination protein n=1 Tax=Ruminococcus sp. TaxID=41978 RepID=UPI0025F738B4|nr:plasmid recombination protein [Ruminococcus sp.]MBQ8965444.1 plasmid recombination protein [Ruminococcus sp.]
MRYQNLGDDIIVKRTLSGCIGKGDLNHNNRSIITSYVDKVKIDDVIMICQRSLKQFYHELFDEALEEFNAKQTRRDRKIPNYQEHIRHSRQEKEFYEVLFQVGNRDDTGIDSEMCKEAAAVLEEYARSFEERNPHLKLFNAVIHLDESTPHLHLDFVPVTDEKRNNGLRVRNSLTGALRQQGCAGKGIGRTITIDWLEQEKAHIGQLMLEHGIEWVKLEETKEGLPLKDFKLKKRQEELDAADKLIGMKLSELSSVEDKVRSAESTLAEKKQDISENEEKLSSVTAETAKADAELSQKVEQVNKVLTYLPDTEKNLDAEHEYLVAVSELRKLLKSGMSILKNKDSILSWIDTLESLTKKAMDKRDKADLTIYSLHKRGDEFIAERDDAREKLKEVRSEKSLLSSELQSVKSENRKYSEVYAMLERIAPSVLERAKALVQEEKAQRQREQQRQAEYQPTKKKKSWGLE